MVARLGFAVATDARPEILLVDEILSVGDVDFQRKSTERMEQLKRQGEAVVLVSHSLDSIRAHCIGAWLDGGRVRAVGPATEVVALYEGQTEG